MAYDAGEAFLRIVPSFDGVIERINAQAARWGTSAGRSFSDEFNRQVRRDTNVPVGPTPEQNRRQGQKAGNTFADSFKARVEAALRSLPDIRIGAATTEAEQKLRDLHVQLQELSRKEIGVDIDAGAALAEIDRIKADLRELAARSPDIALHVNTARATAELDRIRAEIDELRTEDPEVDVKVDDHGSFAEVEGKALSLRSTLLLLAPLAIPIGAALVAGLAGAVAMMGAAAAGAGVLALGLGGVAKTVQLLDQRRAARASANASEVKSSSQVAQAERALADARYNADQQAIRSAEQVKNARQSLAQTERTVARQQIADARDIAAAQRDVAAAEQAVLDAREQAARALLSSSNDATDAQLSQQQAAIDLTNAQQTLASVNADGSKTDLERQQAALDVAKAQQALIEAQQRATQATDDNNKVQKAGVNGAPGVLAAIQHQHDAIDALRLAQVKQRQDARDGAREIAKAEQQVADALRDQKVQAHQSAEAILNAQDAVTQASTSMGTTGQTQLKKINDQLDKVNPATLRFARFVRNDLEPGWRKLKATAAGGLLPGIERGLKAMAPLFSPINRLVGSLSRALGGLADEAGHALSGPFWRQFIDFVTRNAGPMITLFGRIVGNVAKGFAGLIEGFQPLTNAIGGGLLGMSRAFANFGANASKNKAFQSFLAYIRENGPIVIDALKHLAIFVGHLIQALAPVGSVMIKVVDAIAKFLSTIPPSVLGPIALAIGAVVLALGALNIVMGLLALNPIVLLIAAIAAAVAVAAYEIWKHWDAIKTVFVNAFRAIGDFVKAHWPLIVGIITGGIGLAVIEIVRHWGDIKSAFRSAWDWVRDTFSGLWNRATEFITTPISDAKAAIGRVWGDIKSAARDFVGDIKTIWGQLETIFKAPIKFLVNTVLNDGLIKAWNWIADKIPGVDITINPIKLPKGFATGGIFPGYTPGRDTGVIAVGGGEAIMRPEWTRAVGPSYVHAANSAARAGGVQGVQRFLGGFSTGGVVPGYSAGGIANPANWVEWFKHKISGPLHAIDKFSDTDVGKIIVGMPKGIATGMIDAIKDFAHNALDRLVNIGTGLVGGLLGGSVTLGGTVGGGPSFVSPAANQKIAKGMAAKLGWANGANWADLISLWNKESGWSQIADTRVSGLDPKNASVYAYGIAQARPASKYPLAGRPTDLGGVSDAASQIAWGLGYIHDRYGSPEAAWQHELAFNWYDRGGELPVGPSLVYNGTGKAELVAPRQTFEQLMAGKSNDNGPTFLMPITQQPNEDGGALAERVSSRVDFKLRAKGGRG